MLIYLFGASLFHKLVILKPRKLWCLKWRYLRSLDLVVYDQPLGPLNWAEVVANTWYWMGAISPPCRQMQSEGSTNSVVICLHGDWPMNWLVGGYSGLSKVYWAASLNFSLVLTLPIFWLGVFHQLWDLITKRFRHHECSIVLGVSSLSMPLVFVSSVFDLKICCL